MNNDEQILAELRKISAWADLSRKMTKWSMIFLAIFIPAMVLLAFLLDHEVKTTVAQLDASTWYDVDRDVRAGNYEKALKLGEELIQKTSLDPDAHRRLANAYLAAGKIDKAREHFAEAVRLFPSEDNEKLLAAIDKKIKAENQKP